MTRNERIREAAREIRSIMYNNVRDFSVKLDGGTIPYTFRLSLLDSLQRDRLLEQLRKIEAETEGKR